MKISSNEQLFQLLGLQLGMGTINVYAKGQLIITVNVALIDRFEVGLNH